MSLLERNPKYMSLMEKVVSDVASEIHYGGGPRLQEIADELADKYRLIAAAPQLLAACKALLKEVEDTYYESYGIHPGDDDELPAATVARALIVAAEKEG